MSENWDVWCRTCNVGLGLDVRHGEASMHQLVRLSTQIAGLQAVTDTLNDRYGTVEIKVSVLNVEVNMSWFNTHRGHDLIPRDEYGRFADQCGEWIRCGTCNTMKKCVLPLKHENEHAVKLDDG